MLENEWKLGNNCNAWQDGQMKYTGHLQSTLFCPLLLFSVTSLSWLFFIRTLPFIHHPNFCIVVWQQLISLASEPSGVMYWLSLLLEDWNLCQAGFITSFVAGYILSSVSLLTMTAISVDRLLALLLGLRYRQVVSLKRTYLLLSTFWIVSILAGISYFVNYRIAIWYSYIAILLCLVTATFSYMLTFHRLHHRNQVQVHFPIQPSEPVSFNMARYRKAVNSALWLQLTLVVCYLPYGMTVTVRPRSKLSPSEFIVLKCALTLIDLNSSLNPFLYCWRITEVRQAVKETIRQAICCA